MATADLESDADPPDINLEPDADPRKARRCQEREKRVDHAHGALRGDDHIIPPSVAYNCRRLKDRTPLVAEAPLVAEDDVDV